MSGRQPAPSPAKSRWFDLSKKNSRSQKGGDATPLAQSLMPYAAARQRASFEKMVQKIVIPGNCLQIPETPVKIFEIFTEKTAISVQLLMCSKILKKIANVTKKKMCKNLRILLIILKSNRCKSLLIL